jgi:hypothetical protein
MCYRQFTARIRLILCVVISFAGTALAAPNGQLGVGLSVGEKSERVDSTLAGIKSTLKFTLKRLNRARDNKDIIQVNCVNDKLTGIKGFLKIAE